MQGRCGNCGAYQEFPDVPGGEEGELFCTECGERLTSPAAEVEPSAAEDAGKDSASAPASALSEVPRPTVDLQGPASALVPGLLDQESGEAPAPAGPLPGSPDDISTVRAPVPVPPKVAYDDSPTDVQIRAPAEIGDEPPVLPEEAKPTVNMASPLESLPDSLHHDDDPGDAEGVEEAVAAAGLAVPPPDMAADQAGDVGLPGQPPTSTPTGTEIEPARVAIPPPSAPAGAEISPAPPDRTPPGTEAAGPGYKTATGTDVAWPVMPDAPQQPAAPAAAAPPEPGPADEAPQPGRRLPMSERPTAVPGRLFLDEQGRPQFVAPADATAEGDTGAAAEQPGGEIGRGSVSRVLLVRDDQLGRDIAVKEPQSPELLEAFLCGTRILGRLEHPSILPVLGLAQRPDGRHFCTMPVIRGRSLAQVLNGCRSLSDRLKLLRPFVTVCQALAHAHSRGVVHRDVNPHHIMLGEHGEVVLMGWGRARARGESDFQAREMSLEVQGLMEGHAGEAGAGSSRGEPAYMSPEQAGGDIGGLDESSDVWSLGAVLYELITGRPPYYGSDPHEVFLEVLREPVPPIDTAMSEGVPTDLAAICEKALSRSRSGRYANAAEMARDLESFLNGDWVRAFEHSKRGRGERLVWLWRTFRIPIVATSAAVLLLLVLGLWRHFAVVGQRDDALAAEAKAAAERDRALEAEREMVAERDRTAESERRARKYLASDLLQKAREAEETHERFVARTYASAALANAELSGARSLLASLSLGLRPRLMWHDQPSAVCRALDYSSEDRIACASGNRVLIWDAKTGVETMRLSGHRGEVRAVAFSPDGRILASGGKDQTVRVWDVTSGDGWARLTGHGKPVTAVAFSPDGKTLASAGGDRTVRIWDLTSSEQVLALQGHDKAVNAVAFSPDGGQVASAGDDRTVRIWDLSSKNPVRLLLGHDKAVAAITFAPDGKHLASGGGDKSVRFWDLTTGESTARVLGQHDGAVAAVALSPDGKTLASSGRDGAVRFWNVESGKALTPVVRHEARIRSIAFSADGQRIVSASDDGGVRISEAGSGAALARLGGSVAPVRVAAFTPDGKKLIAGRGDGAIMRKGLDAEHGSAMRLASIARDLRFLALSADGTRAAGDDGRRVQVWDLSSGESLIRLPARARAAAFSQDGELLALAAFDRSVRVWDLVVEKEIASLKGAGKPITCLVFSRKGRLLVAGSEDGSARLWNLASRGKSSRHEIEDAQITAAAFSPDNRWIALGTDRQGVRLWYLRRDRAYGPLPGLEGEVTALGYSPDGRQLAAGTAAGEQFLWETPSGKTNGRLKLIGRLARHDRAVTTLDFSPDSKLLATGSADSTVRYWRLSGASEFRDLPETGAAGIELLAADERDFGLKLMGPRIVVDPALFATRFEFVEKEQAGAK